MQAIAVKYLPPTDRRGARLKAYCERGSITTPYPHELSRDEAPEAAAKALVAKFVEEDKEKYGSENNPWTRPRVAGGHPNGETVFVYLETHGRRVTVEFPDVTTASDFRTHARIAQETHARGRQISGANLGILRDSTAKGRVL